MGGRAGSKGAGRGGGIDGPGSAEQPRDAAGVWPGAGGPSCEVRASERQARGPRFVPTDNGLFKGH